jgi:hypothetical protein
MKLEFPMRFDIGGFFSSSRCVFGLRLYPVLDHTRLQVQNRFHKGTDQEKNAGFA